MYLTLDGRFSAKANIRIIYQDAMEHFGQTFTANFDELIELVIYPTFINRFSSKFSLPQNDTSNRYQKALKIANEQDCLEYGHDCTVALNTLSNALIKCYRIFSVLNEEFGPSVYSSTFDWERYYGTLVANMNFLLSNEYEQFWHSLKTSKVNLRLRSQKKSLVNVASLQLQNDLTQLLDAIVPSQNLSLTDILGLLGYSNTFKVSGMISETEASSAKRIDCSAFDKSFGSTCRNLKFIDKLYPLHGFDPLYVKKSSCDLGLYVEQWKHYLRALHNATSVDPINHLKGDLNQYILSKVKYVLYNSLPTFTNKFSFYFTHRYFINSRKQRIWCK